MRLCEIDDPILELPLRAPNIIELALETIDHKKIDINLVFVKLYFYSKNVYQKHINQYSTNRIFDVANNVKGVLKKLNGIDHFN